MQLGRPITTVGELMATPIVRAYQARLKKNATTIAELREDLRVMHNELTTTAWRAGKLEQENQQLRQLQLDTAPLPLFAHAEAVRRGGCNER